MAMAFKTSGTILFSAQGDIVFGTTCCCSSDCARCNANQSIPTGYLIQVDFASTGTIADGATGCDGTDVCEDFNGATFILNNVAACRWSSTSIPCDNANKQIDFELDNDGGNARFNVKVIYGGNDGAFDITPGVNNCYDEMTDGSPPIPAYNAGNSADAVCIWSNVTVAIQVLDP